MDHIQETSVWKDTYFLNLGRRDDFDEAGNRLEESCAFC